MNFTDRDLENLFAPTGDLVSAKVFVDPATGEGRGFGFVSFSNIADAQNAISRMNGVNIAPGVTMFVQPKNERSPNNFQHMTPPSMPSSSRPSPFMPY